ncbi:MAG TPA: hypothetical protein VFU15_14210 [Bacteroidia bacterium]|nr:hypothetical protein [Bacteroidia bacterium]
MNELWVMVHYRENFTLTLHATILTFLILAGCGNTGLQLRNSGQSSRPSFLVPFTGDSVSIRREPQSTFSGSDTGVTGTYNYINRLRCVKTMQLKIRPEYFSTDTLVKMSYDDYKIIYREDPPREFEDGNFYFYALLDTAIHPGYYSVITIFDGDKPYSSSTDLELNISFINRVTGRSETISVADYSRSDFSGNDYYASHSSSFFVSPDELQCDDYYRLPNDNFNDDKKPSRKNYRSVVSHYSFREVISADGHINQTHMEFRDVKTVDDSKMWQ